MPSDEEVKRITERAVAEVVPHDEFVQGLRSGRRLRIKMGFDPTKPVITMGWAVGIRKLRQLQDLGHTVVVIIGDWTARIGDPSGRSETRQMLTEEEVTANSTAILEQFFKILDRSQTEVRRQTEWFNEFTLADVVRLSARFTVAQLLERDDFSKRYKGQHPIGIHELLYPLLQGYDSVAIESDVEFGGTDQKFNILVGRELQREMGLKCGPAGQGQAVLLVPMLIGLDGKRKMSQSFDNFIGIDAPAHDMYGKLMSIPDALIGDYFDLLTDVPDEEIAEVRRVVEDSSANPMEHKKRLAREIVTQFHSETDAQEAESHFVRTFSQGEISAELATEIPSDRLPLADRDGPADSFSVKLPALLTQHGAASSTSEARRLIQQRAVEIDGEIVTDTVATVKVGSTLRVGKHRFLRVVGAE
ncbi:MAG: tyrosine--tRNA ligase [Chloroflexi bacterium]|nr:tyrosine--tRNA ligase [Chloroflexota bacterium]